jgi:N6-adenosine-specific RNA methylase IME4
VSQSNLRQSKYACVVADPPWDVQRLASPGNVAFGTQDETLRSIRLEYPTMTVGEIAALPVASLAAEDAHLYVWTINRYIDETYDIARAWGFEPKTLLTWAKKPMGLGPGGAFSQTSEHILFARRGRDISKARIDSTWWQWPRGRHSAKPDAFQDIVEQVSPGPYVELFARRDRLGWDTWGNESLGTAEFPHEGRCPLCGQFCDHAAGGYGPCSEGVAA